MSYYVIKVYGLVCDVCGNSVEVVPLPDTPDNLAWARWEAAKVPDSFRFINGKDVCPKRDAEHLAALTGADRSSEGRRSDGQ